ncbi:hypothetical protein MPH_12904 [Macrophomina phaseolina MS6]|uniref:Uncharacterized protein n=1 Tax=Macrophomina phaseolina (strain MS6) TaxID=1126212 RepID=K2S029_MACPH|nr:hypothetical protein MPH_12904 [Macrophomina phaseolina MS6]
MRCSAMTLFGLPGLPDVKKTEAGLWGCTAVPGMSVRKGRLWNVEGRMANDVTPKPSNRCSCRSPARTIWAFVCLTTSCNRSCGWPGPMGTQAPPDLRTARTASGVKADFPKQNSTMASGPTPRRTRCCASCEDSSSSSVEVKEASQETTAKANVRGCQMLANVTAWD